MRARLREGQRDGHEKVTPGLGGERVEGTKPYQYGDPVSELDLHATLRNALARHGLSGKGSDATTRPLPQPDTPGEPLRHPAAPMIRFDERDLELHQHEGLASCSTVVLIDMSCSMMRHGWFLAAKRVAMA